QLQPAVGYRSSAPIPGSPRYPLPNFQKQLQYLAAKTRQLQTSTVWSPEPKFSEYSGTVSKRVTKPISPVDSFFAHDFRAPLCSRRAYRGRGRMAIAENYFASDRLHGVRAHGSHAFQPARLLGP